MLCVLRQIESWISPSRMENPYKTNRECDVSALPQVFCSSKTEGWNEAKGIQRPSQAFQHIPRPSNPVLVANPAAVAQAGLQAGQAQRLDDLPVKKASCNMKLCQTQSVNISKCTASVPAQTPAPPKIPRLWAGPSASFDPVGWPVHPALKTLWERRKLHGSWRILEAGTIKDFFRETAHIRGRSHRLKKDIVHMSYFCHLAPCLTNMCRLGKTEWAALLCLAGCARRQKCCRIIKGKWDRRAKGF